MGAYSQLVVRNANIQSKIDMKDEPEKKPGNPSGKFIAIIHPHTGNFTSCFIQFSVSYEHDHLPKITCFS